MKRRSAAVLVATLVAVAAACARPASTLRLVTTTTIEGSGLLEAILPGLKEACACDVQAVAFGTGQALSVFEKGDADISMTHDPEREQQSVAAGYVQRYSKVMFNDFVIAGPPADPAIVKAATNVVEAMQRIVRAGAPFASRADNSGTHSRELSLWTKASVTPSSTALVETGQGMSATLRVASERRAYVLTDRSTLSQLAPTLQLEVLFEGGDELINTYAVMIRRELPQQRLVHATALFSWLTDGQGRTAIEAFRTRGQQTFHVWPANAPRDQPGDLPHVR